MIGRTEEKVKKIGKKFKKVLAFLEKPAIIIFVR